MTEESRNFVEFIYCGCGCGNTRAKYDKRGRIRKYIYRHEKKRNQSPFWKGGRRQDKGYWWIYYPEHHFASKTGYVLEHRYVYEQYYKCCLLSFGHIHHKNRIRSDNRIENLELLSRLNHIRLHKIKDFSNRYCLICNTNISKTKTGENVWLKKKDGFWCNKCYNKKKWHEKYKYSQKNK